MNEGVNMGVITAVVGRERSTDVIRGVGVTMLVGVAAHALKVAYSTVAVLSARNLSLLSVLTYTL